MQKFQRRSDVENLVKSIDAWAGKLKNDRRPRRDAGGRRS